VVLTVAIYMLHVISGRAQACKIPAATTLKSSFGGSTIILLDTKKFKVVVVVVEVGVASVAG